MIYIRMGPRFLFIRTENIHLLQDFIHNSLQGTLHSFEEALEYSTENSTIIFLTPPNLTHTRVEDAQSILLVPLASSIILMEFINQKISDQICRIQLGPASLVLRVAGDGKEALEQIQREYPSRALNWLDAIDQGEVDDTIISLTNKAINHNLLSKDFIHPNLLVSMSVNGLAHRLRNEGLIFITYGLKSKEWYELRINIYDSKGLYHEHLERLQIALSEMEAGMILGESWTKDHALMLFSVVAYQVKLFTMLEPIEIKKTLMALEYDSQGKRLVDLDLYHRNKKISWTHIGGIRSKFDKEKTCVAYRDNLLKQLSKDTLDRLFEIERKINESM
ncbi:hypothetical protein [Geosporobacter ferrireducens]|uniref:Uncharacterized protein n=1 Tax=Geosporobacter ferrireducens TaxID=1424294 RepID=A0A1D8GDW8_9FIRM|nr:hypothetical protein [Geosporobacter ferrireducens]AOT69104.1 hypothetical protein Gferi_05750 [Geosporobacter ferrireducens]MTI56779.1 hypothetical protein [Geosporobacter ferrireducens]